MPLHITSHPVELPDSVLSYELKLRQRFFGPFLWILPMGPFLVYGDVISLDLKDRSQFIAEMDW
jgi:hypothetical protein